MEPTPTALPQHPEMTAGEALTTDAPVSAAHEPEINGVPNVNHDAAVAAPVEEKKAEVAPAVEKKPVEPITEGQLSYKGPGVLKYASTPSSYAGCQC